jgi:hypothetical protein
MRSINTDICGIRIFKICTIFLCIAIFLPNKFVFAQRLERIDIDKTSPFVGETVRFSIALRSDSEIFGCGFEVDFGDGNKRQIRILSKADSPATVEHVYKKEGNYAVKIDGVFLQRGLKSVSACEKSLAQSVLVRSAMTKTPECIPPPDEYRAISCPPKTIGTIIERRTFSCPGPIAGPWSPQSIDCREPRLIDGLPK